MLIYERIPLCRCFLVQMRLFCAGCCFVQNAPFLKKLRIMMASFPLYCDIVYHLP
jgi:hypothetical protein